MSDRSGAERMDLALKVWRQAGVPVRGEVGAGVREATVETIGGALESVAARRRGARRAHKIVLAAAAVLLVAGLGTGLAVMSSGRPEVAGGSRAAASPRAALHGLDGVVARTARGGVAAVAPGRSIDIVEGDEVGTAPDSRARLELPGQVDVVVAQAARLIVRTARPREKRIELSLGRVELSVPKGSGRVSVKTPDAEVVVHGTVLSVEVRRREETGEPVTRVAVSRGVVSVLHGGETRFVNAGEQWASQEHDPSGRRAEPELEAAAAPAIAATPAVASATAPAVASALSGRSPPAAGGKALTQQNRIFQAALDARNRGDDRRSLALFDELLGRFHDTPLSHEARVERMRALARLGDHAAAAREARRYLALHPKGPARDEARRLALAAAAPPAR